MTRTDYITVNMRPPVANFAATGNTGIWPLNVSSTSSSTGDAPLSYQWSFGDGSPNSTVKNPYHVYNNPGTYNVILTVTNPVGSSSLARNGLVQVNNPSIPVVAFTGNVTSGYKPMAVKFTSTSTGAGVLTYNWTFGDGNTSTLKIPTNIYNVTGIYTVKLTVTSNYSGYVTSNSLTKTNMITVMDPTKPAANFSANQTYGEWPLAVAFQDLSTGTPAPTYLWDFGDGNTSTLQSPVHIYNWQKAILGGARTYTVTLTNSMNMRITMTRRIGLGSWAGKKSST
jgi:PKD repeat protein